MYKKLEYWSKGVMEYWVSDAQRSIIPLLQFSITPAFHPTACRRGITSFPNRRILFSTSSWGIAPMRTIAMKVPKQYDDVKRYSGLSGLNEIMR